MLIKHFSYFIPLQFAICNYFVFFAVNVFHGNGMSFIGIPFALLRLAGEKKMQNSNENVGFSCLFVSVHKVINNLRIETI